MINVESFDSKGVLLSALVVQKSDGTPGYGFTKFMREIGALRSESEVVEFWVREVSRVYAAYAQPKGRP